MALIAANETTASVATADPVRSNTTAATVIRAM